MNSFRILLPAMLLTCLVVACNSNDVPPPMPQLELNKQYNAVKLRSEGIHIGVRGKWLLWSQDSVLIKSYISRVIGEENDPGFLPVLKVQNVTEPQRLTLSNELALFFENGQNTTYTYQQSPGSPLLWLRSTDTLTYYENERPEVISKLGYFSPIFHEKVLAPENEDYKYRVRTVAERYFNILTGELQAPGFIFHLKTYDGKEDSGNFQNYLGDQGIILNSLPLGDTLLMQPYRLDYAY